MLNSNRKIKYKDQFIFKRCNIEIKRDTFINRVGLDLGIEREKYISDY